MKRCTEGGDCNGGYMRGTPFRCTKCKRMPNDEPQPPMLCGTCCVMHVPYETCPSVDEAGVIAIIALQKAVGITETHEDALEGWKEMSLEERANTLAAYRVVVAAA